MIKTHTFYRLADGSGTKSESRKLSIATLLKRGAVEAYYRDIDVHNLFTGYINRKPVNLKGV